MMLAARAAVGASAKPARERRAGGRVFPRSGVRPRRAVGDETDAWMTRDVPPPVSDVPHETGDLRNEPVATTSETRVPSEDAETVVSSPRSTDGEDEWSRRETTETARDDEDATNEKTPAEERTKAQTRFGAALFPEKRLELDPERSWRAKLASLSKSFDRGSVQSFESFEAVERRLTGAASRVADAFPADLAAALSDLTALAPSSAESVGWLERSDAARTTEDGTTRFEAILESIVSETPEARASSDRASSDRASSDGASSDGAASATVSVAKRARSEEDVRRASSSAERDDDDPTRAFPRVSDATAPAFLFVRGLFGEHYPCYQWDAAEHFRRRGATARLSRAARGAGTTEANAEALCAEILAFADELGADVDGNQRRVVLVGHSKGGVDACAALALHEHRLRDVVLGVITVQSPYGGSPIASDLTATTSLRNLTARALEVLLRAREGEGARALLPPLLDVTYESRLRFLKHHPLPERFFAVSFHTDTNSRSSVLAPFAAYVRGAYGAANDGLVCRADAEVPGCVAVRWHAECDHADGAYPRRMSEERYRAYRDGVAKRSAEHAVRGRLAGDGDPAGTRVSENRLPGDNAMVPLAEARARALLERDARRVGGGGARGRAVLGEGFSGELGSVFSGLARHIRRALDGDRAGGERREGSARDAGANDRSFSSRGEARGEDEEDADASVPPPGAGELLVRAYLALNAADPERLGSTADQGEIHEALASLLMERAEAAREDEFGDW